MPTNPARSPHSYPGAKRHALAAVARFTLAAACAAGVVAGGGCAARPSTSAVAPVATTTPTAARSAGPTGAAEPTISAGASAAAATASEGVSATEVPGVVEIGWVGDTTPGSKYGSPPKSGRALFEKVREQLLGPDLMIGNLEGTFGGGGKSKSKEPNTYVFQAPPKNAEALSWAGFDVMSLANNHAYDYLEPGLKSTRKALADNGIADIGLPGQITVREVNGVTVAFVAFSPYRWNAPISNISAAQRLVRKAKTKADVVVVLIHAGAEGADKTHTPKGAEKAYGEFRGDSRAFSHAVIDAGASAVLGSGPHVIRGIERYKGKLIAYSLGNFAGWNNFSQAGDLALSGLLTVKIDKNGEILGGRWLSLKITDPGVPVVDKKRTSAKLVEKLSASDFADTFDLDAEGNFGPGK